MPWKCAHGPRNVLSISNTHRLMSWGRGARRNVPQMHWILSTEGIIHASLSDNEEAEQRLWDGFEKVLKLLCSFLFFFPYFLRIPL